MTEPLILCTCGQPATAASRDGRSESLCDDCQANRGRCRPLEQAVRLPYSAGFLRWFRERVAQNNQYGNWDSVARWLVTLDTATRERDEARASAGTLLAILERLADRLTADEAAAVAVEVARAARGKP